MIGQRSRPSGSDQRDCGRPGFRGCWRSMRVLVSADLPGPALDALRAAHEVEVGPNPRGLGHEGILARIAGADALVTLVTDRVD